MKLRTLLVILLIAGCKPETKVREPLFNYLPENAAAVVQINDFAKFKSELMNNAFATTVAELKLFEKLKDKLAPIAFKEPQPKFTVAVYELGKKSFEFLLLTEDKLPSIDLDNVTDKTIESFSYEEEFYNKYILDGITIFAMAVDHVTITTSSQILLENFIRTKKKGSAQIDLRRLNNVADTTASATVFLNFKHADGIFKKYLKEKEAKGIVEFADWMGLDFYTDQNLLALTGICLANDSIKNFVNLLKENAPLPNTLASVAPQNTDALMGYSFSEPATFIKKQTTYLDRAKPKDTLFNSVEEIGIAYLNKERAVILNTFGADLLEEKLTVYQTETTTYQNNEIIALSNSDLLQEHLRPLVTDYKANFYTVLGNSFVFAEDKAILQSFISNTKNRTTFDKTSAYQTASAVMAGEANLSFIANDKGIQHFLDKDFIQDFALRVEKLDLEDYCFAGQLVSDQDFLHANIHIVKTKQELQNNTVGALFTVALDTDLAIDPQFVKNHRTKQQEIVVQDIDNNLYLLSTQGKVLWKKQLNGRIRGKIHQVDLYKNGKLQLAFCTNNQFLILDRNGKEVLPFNNTYKGGNLNALAVFDYDKNRDYRFVVTQGRKVFMYNNSGAIVDGFVYKEAEHAIISAPTHFRISGKDYLIFKLENNTMAIRHRAGQERIKVGTKIDFSNNPIFLYKNKFTITDKKGVLHQVDTKGKLSKTNFNLSNDHGMFATSKTLALMDENILSIKGRKVELELGVYTPPKIFYIYDKIYVSVTDIQNQQIYLFDSQAKPIANFPVYGTSAIDLTDMDQNRKLELVAKDQENSLIIYQIN